MTVTFLILLNMIHHNGSTVSRFRLNLEILEYVSYTWSVCIIHESRLFQAAHSLPSKLAVLANAAKVGEKNCARS